MRLKKYLNEWNKAADEDYPGNGKYVIVFDKDEKYVKSGYTHGSISHSIKHLRDFNISEYDNIVKRIRNYLKSVSYYVKNRSGEILEGVKLDDSMIINCMDLVNDKILKKESLSKEEEFIKKQLDVLLKFYTEAINKFRDSSIDISKFSLEEIKKHKNETLRIKTKTKRTLFINLSNNYFLVTGEKGVITFFKTTIQYIKDQLKKEDLLNKEILKIV